MVPSNSMIGRSPSLQASSTSSPTMAAIFSEPSLSDFAISAVLRAAASGLAAPILVTRLLRQRDRAFAEAFEHEVLDVALFGEFDRGLDAIARIAGTGSYSNGSHIVSRGIASRIAGTFRAAQRQIP